jgi:hypothetical protein
MSDWTELKQMVGSDSTDDVYVQNCWDTATALVEEFIGGEYVPTSIRDRAVLNVGSELYHQRNAPNGLAQFASFETAPVRIARDPMTAAYPLLNRWVVTW